MEKELIDLLKEIGNSKEFKEFTKENKMSFEDVRKGTEDQLIEKIKLIRLVLLFLMRTNCIHKIDCEKISVYLYGAFLLTLSSCAKQNGKTTNVDEIKEKTKMFESTIYALFGVNVRKNVN